MEFKLCSDRYGVNFVVFLKSPKHDPDPWFFFVLTWKQFTSKYIFRRVFHSGFQCKYMFYSSFRVKLSGIKAMAQKHLKWSISQKVLLQPSIWIKVKTSNSFQNKYKKTFHNLRAYPLNLNPLENIFWESPLGISSKFLDAIASPSSYPSQSVGQWVSESVIDSFRFGDSYRISELCELVVYVVSKAKLWP